MLSREDNELLTRVGAGTPMGSLMRRYWIPALFSEQVAEPDCTPVRVALLGERLVGPLPDAVGNVTTYAAALLSGAGGPARDFLAYLATGEAHGIFVATGVLR